MTASSGPVFVGIDSALNNVGLFAFEPDAWWTSHLVQAKPRRGAERLAYLRSEVRSWLDSLPSVTSGAIEDGAYSSAGKIYQLGGIQHILQLELWDCVEASLTEVAPSQLKKFQTGKSGALKKWMKEAATTWLSANSECSARWEEREISNDNIADALGLARIAYAIHTENVTTRAEAEVLVALQDSTRIYEVPSWPTTDSNTSASSKQA